MKTILQKTFYGIAILFVSMLSHPIKAQVTFQKIIGTYAYDAHKVVNGTGYVFGGISNIPTAGVRNCYVVRTDVNGDTLWTSNWGGVAGVCDQQYINDLCPVSDGGVIANGGKEVCGDSTKGGAIVRVGANGNVKWAKSFATFCDPYPCIQTSDGHFISGGYISPQGGFQYTPFDAYLTKMDSATGDTMWSKSYGGSGTIDWFYHILQTADGGYLAAGKTNSFGQGGLDIYLVKTDANGNLMWSKTYGTTLNETAFGHCLQATADGGYIVTGTAGGTQGIFLMKLDGVGNISWVKYYDGLWAHGVKQTASGGYVVSGTSAVAGNGKDVLLFKTDTSGTILWGKNYGNTGSDQGLILEAASDGGFITGGTTGSFGGGLYVIKSDSNGNSGCNETNAVVASSVAPFVAANAATVVSKGPNTYSYSYLFAKGAPLSNLCTTVGINEAMSKQQDIKVYPNPSTGMIKIESEKELGMIIVYNLLGEIVLQVKNTNVQAQIDISKLTTGVYTIEVNGKHIKVIKE
jgi:hypothetical protein